MTISGISIDGIFYDGDSPVAHPAKLTIKGSEVELERGDVRRSYTTGELLVSPRIGQVDRFIKFADGGQYHCSDQTFLDDLPQEIISEGPVAWLEKHVPVAIASIAIVVALLLIGYFYVLPAFAESIVKRIPIKSEVSLGKDFLSWFDESDWFDPSEIDQEQRDLLTSEFNQLHDGLAMSPYIRLEFRNSDIIGPNAFALPGGTIVITDQLIEFAVSNEEILAILAHEAGHVEKRHSMQQVLESSLIALAIATVTADATTAGATLSGLPAVILQSKYSRAFESEADEFSFNLLNAHNISPHAFASIMERLDDTEEGPFGFSFMSTHPITSERIQKARAASQLPEE